MQPFFFGPAERKLFGVFHPAASQTAQDWGVVLCQPLAHEFYNTHRCSNQLAVALSNSGLAVLRFDYFGTGDSAGDWEDVSVSRWLEDIGCAAAEFRRRGIKRLCLIGFRFGATLAAVFSAQRGPVEALILWEPVANGAKYLEELASLHAEMFHENGVSQEGPEDGLLGFEYRECLRNQIRRIDLGALQTSVASNVLLIEGQGQPGEALGSTLQAAGGRVECRIVPSPPFWLPHPRRTPLPPQLAEIMSKWIYEQ